MDNQQQQQMNIEPKRTPREILAISLGLVVIGLIGIWGARQVVPEWRPPV